MSTCPLAQASVKTTWASTNPRLFAAFIKGTRPMAIAVKIKFSIPVVVSIFLKSHRSPGLNKNKINRLCFKRVTLNSLATDKPKALRIPNRIGIWEPWFCGGWKTREPREKTLEERTRTNNNLNLHVTEGLGVEPRPY